MFGVRFFPAALLSASLLACSYAEAANSAPQISFPAPAATPTPAATAAPLANLLPPVPPEQSATPVPSPVATPVPIEPDSASFSAGYGSFKVFVPIAGVQKSLEEIASRTRSLDSRCSPKNKFGAHLLITDGRYDVEIVTQLDKVLELTGPCGWVKGFDTFLDEGSAKKWGFFVSEAWKRKLVPILRMGYGRAPSLGDAIRYALQVERINEIASKYNSPPLFAAEIWNEPNLGENWNGNPDPAAYARFLHSVSGYMRAKAPSTYVMNGALAFTAGDPVNMATEEFIDRMFRSEPGLASSIDIWASHPYPANFADCSPYKISRDAKYCFNGYQFELSVLSKYYDRAGVLLPPVLVTETSWRSNIINAPKSGWWNDKRELANYSPEEFAAAWKTYWLGDSSVIGVTPFLFTTDHPVWRPFSFLDPETLQPNGYYHALQKLRKEKS